jgi:hypothetical protein
MGGWIRGGKAKGERPHSIKSGILSEQSGN